MECTASSDGCRWQLRRDKDSMASVLKSQPQAGTRPPFAGHLLIGQPYPRSSHSPSRQAPFFPQIPSFSLPLKSNYKRSLPARLSIKIPSNSSELAGLHTRVVVSQEALSKPRRLEGLIKANPTKKLLHSVIEIGERKQYPP